MIRALQTSEEESLSSTGVCVRLLTADDELDMTSTRQELLLACTRTLKGSVPQSTGQVNASRCSLPVNKLVSDALCRRERRESD